VRARAPVVAVLNWFSDALPAKEDIAGPAYLKHAGDIPGEWALAESGNAQQKSIAR